MTYDRTIPPEVKAMLDQAGNAMKDASQAMQDTSQFLSDFVKKIQERQNKKEPLTPIEQLALILDKKAVWWQGKVYHIDDAPDGVPIPVPKKVDFKRPEKTIKRAISLVRQPVTFTDRRGPTYIRDSKGTIRRVH